MLAALIVVQTFSTGQSLVLDARAPATVGRRAARLAPGAAGRGRARCCRHRRDDPVDLVIGAPARSPQAPRRLRRLASSAPPVIASAPRDRAASASCRGARRVVHARLAAEAEHVLGLDHRDARAARRAPGGSAATMAPDRRSPRALSSASTRRAYLIVERLVPAASGVVVVGAGVDDPVLDVVAEAVRAARHARVEAELQHHHPGQRRARRAGARPPA